MAKIIVMNIPAIGHVNPTLPVVAELVRRGTKVIYYNTEDFRQQIEQTGAEFRPYPQSALLDVDFSKVAQGALIKVTILIFRVTDQLMGFMSDELTREQPDLVIYDSVCLWGRLSAEKFKLHSVASNTVFVLEGLESLITWREVLVILRGIVTNLAPFLRARSKLIKRLGEAQKLPNPIFPCVGNLNLVFTARALQPPTKYINDTFEFVGPSINAALRTNDFPFEQLQAKPLIYISLGTINNKSLDFYQHCFEAFAGHPAQFVLAVGRQTDINALGPIPANFIVRNYVPQLEILQRANVFVTHAGMNSVQESLYYSVPMVLIPQQMEQLINAKVVQQAGAGIVLGTALSFGKVSAQQLKEAVDEVLKNPAHCEAAQTISTALRTAGGYLKAADLIMEQAVK